MAPREQLVTTSQRIGRFVGVTNFVATTLAVLGLLIWPKVIGSLIAMLSWSDEAKDACAAAPGCAVNVVPGGVLPMWWTLAWVAIIAVSVLVCWPPARWWSSRGKGKGKIEIFADSTPRWLRVHAAVAALVSVVLVFPGRSIAGVWAPDYLIPAGAALLVVGLATLSLRAGRAKLGPNAFDRLIGPGPFSPRVGAASRAAHKPTGARKGSAS